MKKKILAITLLLLMVCCSAVAFAACDDDQTVEETHFVLDRANSSVWGITFDGKDSAAIVEQIGAMIPPESAGLVGAFLTQQFVQNLFDQLIDWEKSGVTLRADGTMTLQLILGSEGLDMVNGILSSFNLLNALGEVDVSSFTNQYLVPIMPGFDFADIADSLELAKGALGVQFVSATEGEALEFLQVVGDLLTTGKEAPEGTVIPDGFGIRLDSGYYVKEVKGTDDTVYNGVYLTPTDPDTQPYIVMDLSKGEDGKYGLNLQLDFLKMNLTLTQA